VADLPTPAELATRGQGVYRTAIDPGGTGAVDLRPGSRNDAMLSVFTGVASRLLGYAAAQFAASRLASAVGDELDVIGVDLFGEPRKDAAAAVGTAYLQRPSGAATSILKGHRFAIPATNSRKAIIFEAAESVAVANAVLSVAVPIVAIDAGELGIVDLAQLTSILDPLEDTGWSLYVPTLGDPVLASGPVDVLGGGADRESDDIYRDRLRQLSTNDPRERGTLRAIVAGALRVPGVRFVTAIEPGDGTVVLYAGDAPYGFGLPRALRLRIDAELLAWRAFGVPVLVRPYTVTAVTLTATIYMARALASYDLAAIRAAALTSAKAYFDRRPRPDEYYVNAIEAALFDAHGEVQDAQLAAPLVNQQRPTDAGYGGVTALNRFVILDERVQINIAPPRTA
jgi:uncharacterized phage protein gp47/JayE